METMSETTTNLPELPEGFFWRVGDSERFTYSRVPAVMIMESFYNRSPREVHTYGSEWWNKNQVVSTKIEYDTVKGERIRMSGTLRTNMCDTKAEIPEFGTFRSLYEGTTVIYSVPLNEDGIRHVAEKLFRRFTREQEEEERKLLEEACLESGKQKYYGDYPPKTLNNN